MKRLIDRTIALPLALHILTQDRDQFGDSFVYRVYVGKIDSAMAHIRRDIPEVKTQLFQQFGVTVRRISATEYRWQSRTESGTVTYTSEELKRMTSDIMREYLGKSVPFASDGRVWERAMMPPDADLD